jgi:biopolymer transport protein TolR
MDRSQFSRKRRKPVAEMNVVPYIDVMLVLLVIFMITAPMLTQGLEVDLPTATADTMTLKEKDPIVVSIKHDGSYWIKSGQDADVRVSLDTIADDVHQAQASHPDVPVLINGDRHVNYGIVVQLMARLQQAGTANVGLLTDPGDTQEP